MEKLNLLRSLTESPDKRVAKPKEHSQHAPINNSVDQRILLNIIQFGTLTTWKRNPLSMKLIVTSQNSEIVAGIAVINKGKLFMQRRLK